MTPAEAAQTESNNARLRKVFSGLDSEPLTKFKTEEEKARAANVAYLAHATKQDPTDVAKTYDQSRAAYAKQILKTEEDPGDLGLYQGIAARFQREEGVRAHVNEIAQNAYAASISSQFMEKEDGEVVTTSWAQAAEVWKKDPNYKAPEIDDPEAQQIYNAAYREAYKHGVAENTETKHLANEVLGQLEIQEGVETEGALRQVTPETFERLRLLPKEERNKIWHFISANASASKIEGDWSANTSKAFQRGFSNTWGHVTDAAARTSVRTIRDNNELSIRKGREVSPSTLAEITTTVDPSKKIRSFIQAGEMRPLTREETVLAQELARDLETDLDIGDEIRDARQQSVNPMAYSGGNRAAEWVANKVWLPALNQVGYMATAASTWTAPLLVAATQDMRYEEYRNRGLDDNQAASLATVSAILEAPIERLQFKTLTGKKFHKGVLGARGILKSKLGASGVNLAANIATQNIQEAIQDITPLVVQSFASSLSEEFPDVDWDTELEKYAKGRVDTFWSLLPMAVLGAGAATAKDIQETRAFLEDKPRLQALGVSDIDAEEIVQHTVDGDYEAAAKRFQSAERGEVDTEAFDQVAELQEELSNSPHRPHIKRMPDGQAEVKFEDGETVTVPDARMAELVVADHMRQREEDNVKAFDDLMGFFREKTGAEINEDIREVSFVSAIEEGTLTTEEARQRIQDYEAESGLVFGDNAFARFSIAAENVAEFREGSFRNIVNLFSKKNPFALVEDVSEGFFKKWIGQGERQKFDQWMGQYQEASGDVLLQDIAGASEQSMVEALSSLATAYFQGNVERTSLPHRLKMLLRQMGEYLGYLATRAKKLERSFREGKVDSEFEVRIAKSVGLDEAGLLLEAGVDRARQNAFQALVKDAAEQVATFSVFLTDQIAQPDVVKAVRDTLKLRGSGLPLPGGDEPSFDFIVRHGDREEAIHLGHWRLFEPVADSIARMEAVGGSISSYIVDFRNGMSVDFSFHENGSVSIGGMHNNLRPQEATGFRTWPRLGFDGPSALHHDAPKDVRDRKWEISETPSILNLTETAEGRKLWAEWGKFFDATWSLHNEASRERTLKTFNSFLKIYEKRKLKGAAKEVDAGNNTASASISLSLIALVAAYGPNLGITEIRTIADGMGRAALKSEFEHSREVEAEHARLGRVPDHNERVILEELGRLNFPEPPSLNLTDMQELRSNFAASEVGQGPRGQQLLGRIDQVIEERSPVISEHPSGRFYLPTVELDPGLPLESAVRHIANTPFFDSTNLNEIDNLMRDMLVDGFGQHPNFTILKQYRNQLSQSPAATFSIIPDTLEEQINNLFTPPAFRFEQLSKALTRVREVEDRFAKLKRDAESNQTIVDRLEVAQGVAQLEAIASALPSEVRGKLRGFSTVARRATDRGRLTFLLSRLQRMDELLDKFIADESRRKFENLIGRARAKRDRQTGRLKSTLGPEAAADLALVDTYSKLSPEDIETLRGQLLSDIATAEDATPIYNKLHIIDLFGSINNMNAERSTRALEQLRDFLQNSRFQWREIQEARKEDIAKRVTLAQKEAGLAAKIDPLDKDKTLREERDGWKKLTSWTKGWMVEILSWRQFLVATFGDGKTAERFERDALTAKNAYIDARLERQADLNQWLADKLGLESQRERNRWLTGLKEVQESTDVHRLDGREMDISQDEAIYYTMVWDQLAYRKNLTEHDKIDENTIEQMEDFLTTESKQFRAYLAEQYSGEYGRINAVYREQNGVDMPMVNNYAPVSVEMADGSDLQIDPNANTVRSGMAAGFTKLRVNHNMKLRRQGASIVYWAHATEADYYVTHQNLAREVRSVLMNKDIIDGIAERHGARRVAALNKWTEQFFNRGLRQAGVLMSTEGAMSRMTKSLAVVGLAYNISTMFKQASAMFGSLAEVPAGAWASGFVRVLLQPSSMSHIWKSETIRRRVMNGFSPEMQLAMSANNQSPSVINNILANGLGWIGHADAVFTTISASIAYDYHFRKAQSAGLSEADAKEKALNEMDVVIARTAQPTSNVDKSLFELGLDSNAIAKLFFMFRSEPRQKLAITMMGVREMLKGENKLDGARAATVAWGIMPLVTLLVGHVFQDIFRDDDGEEDPLIPDDPNAYLHALIAGQSSGMLYFGDAFEAASALALDQPAWLSTENLVVKAVQGIAKGGEVLDKGLDEITMKDVNSFARAVSIAVGGRAAALGVGTRTLRDLTAFKEEIALPKQPDPEDKFRDLLRAQKELNEVEKRAKEITDEKRKPEDPEPKAFKTLRRLEVGSGLRAQGIKRLLDNAPEGQRRSLRKQLKEAKLLSSTVEKQLKKL